MSLLCLTDPQDLRYVPQPDRGAVTVRTRTAPNHLRDAIVLMR